MASFDNDSPVEGAEIIDASSIAQGDGSEDIGPGAPLRIGSTIAERYVVVSLLESGEANAIYKVQHLVLKQMFALKILSSPKPSLQAIKKFDNEARLANRLAHPNFPNVHFVSELDGRPYLIMDLVEGQSLYEYSKLTGTLSVDEVLRIFIPICFALDYAHSNGIIHADLKPTSIILSKAAGQSDLTPKICDISAFRAENSVASAFNEKITAQEMLAQSLYISPEESTGNSTDCRSSIYSLGCVIYEALTGAPPFHGDTAHDVMQKHKLQEPSSLKEASMGRDYPGFLEDVVAKALRKNPGARYQSFVEMANDLQSARNRSVNGKSSVTVTAEPELVAEPVASRELRTNWKLIALVIVTNVFSIVTTCFLMTHFLHQESSAVKLSSDTHDYVSDVATSRSMFMTVTNSGSGQRRTFHFPNISLGKFSYFDAHKVTWVDFNAEGSVTVPMNCLTKFETEDRIIAERPSTLRLFGANDITHLTINSTKIRDYEENMAPIVDAAMAYVSRYSNLSQLILSGLPITDVGVHSLQNLPNLVALDICESKASMASIKQLKNYKLMTMLRISDVLDAKKLIPDFLTNPNLRILALSNSDLEDSDLELLGQIPLHSLEIQRNPKVTDKGLHYLTKNTQLIDLDLIGDAITPAGIDDLAKFKSLQGLRLSVQTWKKGDVQKLVSVLPKDCRLIPVLPEHNHFGFRGVDWQKELP
jgi:serine/threonine protein kinase